MASLDFPNEFYIGRRVNPEDGETSTEAQTYDPDDLTTHAVVVGMTCLLYTSPSPRDS